MGVSRKQSTSNFPKNVLCVSGGKICSFFGKFGMLCFLETNILRFALLPYHRRLNPAYSKRTLASAVRINYFYIRLSNQSYCANFAHDWFLKIYFENGIVFKVAFKTLSNFYKWAFCKIPNGLWPLNVFAKSFTLDVWQVSK